MSITRTTEISNYEKEEDEKEISNYFMNTMNTFRFPTFDLDWFSTNWVYIFVFLWMLFSVLSIHKHINCDVKYILLSLIPFVNIYLYFSNFCNAPFSIREISNRENFNRQGIGVTMQYPTFLQSSNNKATNNKSKNNYKPMNIKANNNYKPMNIKANNNYKPMNNNKANNNFKPMNNNKANNNFKPMNNNKANNNFKPMNNKVRNI